MPSPGCDSCKETCSEGQHCGADCKCGDNCSCGDSENKCDCPAKKPQESEDQ